MDRIFRFLSYCFSLLCRGQLFLLAEAVLTKLLSDRRIGMNKTVFYRLSRQDVPSNRDSGDIIVFRGDEESVRRLVRDLYHDTETAREFYGNYLREGAEPWLAENNNRIVGSVWLFTGTYTVPWEGYDAWLLRVEVEPTAKFVANVLVDPEMRGRGIFSLVARRCYAAHPDSEFYSCVDETNIPSIKSHEKLGFHRCGTAYMVRLFGGTRCLFWPKKGKSRLFKMERGTPFPVSLLPCKRD